MRAVREMIQEKNFELFDQHKYMKYKYTMQHIVL